MPVVTEDSIITIILNHYPENSLSLRKVKDKKLKTQQHLF